MLFILTILILGLTPLKGLTRRTGLEQHTMVSAGPMAKHAEDLAPFLRVLCGPNTSKLHLDQLVSIKRNTWSIFIAYILIAVYLYLYKLLFMSCLSWCVRQSSVPFPFTFFQPISQCLPDTVLNFGSALGRYIIWSHSAGQPDRGSPSYPQLHKANSYMV